MKTIPCRGCGKPIVFALTADGKKIPLDPRPPLYFAFEGEAGLIIGDRIRSHVMADIPGAPEAMPMVTHFATCPKANQFSRSNKQGGTAA